MKSNYEAVRRELVRVYCEATRQLDFLSELPVTVNEAVDIMVAALEVDNASVEGYNDFSPSLLWKLPEGTEVYLAREGSVCVYVRIPAGAVLTKHYALRDMKADEYSLTGRTVRPEGTIRLWWD